MPEQMQGHIVAELNDVDNRQIVELIGEMDVEVRVVLVGRAKLDTLRHYSQPHQPSYDPPEVY